MRRTAVAILVLVLAASALETAHATTFCIYCDSDGEQWHRYPRPPESRVLDVAARAPA